MAKVHAYLNFNGNCEEAFNFYKKIFKTEFTGMYRFGDMPADPNASIQDRDKDKIMHVGLAINAHTYLMGSDCLESFGQKVTSGNSVYTMLDVESIEEAQELYEGLSANAKNMEMELGETFFAERFASFIDQFGIAWMIHFEGNKKM